MRRAIAFFAISFITVTLAAQSSDVKLPHLALGLGAAGARLVTVGVDEMIAVSDDHGSSWQTVHETPLGDALVGVSFQASTGIAFGTNGLLLLSTDSGLTWKRVPGLSDRVAMAVASDANHVLAITGSADSHSPGGLYTKAGKELWLTRDGGRQWTNLRSVVPEPAKLSEVLAVATLDDKNMVWLFHQSEGENYFVSSTDGGDHWKTLHLDNTFAHTLLAKDGEYWALGIEYVDRSNHGGYSVALALDSKDGVTWEHGARPPRQFQACTWQGCFVDPWNIERVFEKQPNYLHAGERMRFSEQWAFSGDTVCSAWVGLRCAPLRQDSRIQEPPEDAIFFGPGTIMESCLRCERVTASSRQGKFTQSLLLLRADENPDGTLSSATLQGAIEDSVREQLLGSISNWVLTPEVREGKRTSAKLQKLLMLDCVPTQKNAAFCSLRGLAPQEEDMIRKQLQTKQN